MANSDQYAYEINLHLDVRGSDAPRVSSQEVEEQYWPELDSGTGPDKAADAHISLTDARSETLRIFDANEEGA